MKKVLTGLGLLLTSIAMAQSPYPAAPAPAGKIIGAEYFYDTDPGFGNGTQINLTPSYNITSLLQTLVLQGAALTNGIHRVFIRTVDENGQWSFSEYRQFDNIAAPPYAVAPGAAGQLTAMEYFIDADPGTGNATAIPVPAGTNINGQVVTADVTGLTPGVHRIFVRSRNENGVWSLTHFSIFDNSYIPPYPAAPPAAPPVSQLEYYIDTDPGIGNATALSIPASPDVNQYAVDIPVAGLSMGTHTLFIRSRQNPWSLTTIVPFSVSAPLPLTWLYFKGEINYNAALLSWSTQEEENTSHFLVEHSTDGSHFKSIGQVSAFNTAGIHTYRFTHEAPAAGINYYRINQIDKDGRNEYSKTVTLVYRNELKEPIPAPNPVQKQLSVLFPAAVSVKSWEIYNSAGVLVKKGESQAASDLLLIGVGDLAPGYYTISIIYNNQRKVLRFIK